MPLYEKLDVHGQVVERVQTIEGSTHDTILGVHALEGTGGWRLAGATPPDPAPTAEPETAAEPTEQPTAPADPEPTPEPPTRAPRPRPPKPKE